MSAALVVEPSNESCRCSVRPAVSSTISHFRYVVDKAPTFTRPRRRQQPSLKMGSVCLFVYLLVVVVVVVVVTVIFWGSFSRSRSKTVFHL